MLSVADALMAMLAGATKVAPLAGLVIAADGAVFAALTVTVTAADVVVAPPLSVARAVSV